MRVFVTGASGLIGATLCARLCDAGHDVVGLSRSASGGRGDSRIRWVEGDPALAGAWTDEVVSADAVVHLAGESVAGRWTAARKRALISSRLDSTRLIVDALSKSERDDRIFVCASAAGYYGRGGEQTLTERAGPGSDFLAQLCVDWEGEAARARKAGCRVVMLRFGIVLSPSGGALANMLPIFKLGLGGPLAGAELWFPWVSLDDAVSLAAFALEQPIDGPINVVAPEPARMGTFAKTLGRVLERPVFAPTVPTFALRLVFGEFGDHVVPGQHIEPEAAIAAGFAFAHPTLEGALRSLLDLGPVGGAGS